MTMKAHSEDGTLLPSDSFAIVMDSETGELSLFIPNSVMDGPGEDTVPDHVFAFIMMATKFRDDEDFREDLVREYRETRN